jgi:toxin ParE1/3/4
VAVLRFSRRARSDVLEIATYTMRTWGEEQTIHYLDDLEARCHMLADNPALGRSCQQVLPGLRRMEHGKHVIFYRRETAGILISRILHQRMLPSPSVFDDQDQES